MFSLVGEMYKSQIIKRPPVHSGRATRNFRGNSRRLRKERICRAFFQKRQAFIEDKSVQRSADFALYIFQVASGCMPDFIDIADVGNNTYPTDQVKIMFHQLIIDAEARRLNIKHLLLQEYVNYKKGTGRYAAQLSFVELATESLMPGGIANTTRKYGGGAPNPRGKCTLLAFLLMGMVAVSQAKSGAKSPFKNGKLDLEAAAAEIGHWDLGWFGKYNLDGNLIAPHDEYSFLEQVAIMSESASRLCVAPALPIAAASAATAAGSGGTLSVVAAAGFAEAAAVYGSCYSTVREVGLLANIGNLVVRTGAAFTTKGAMTDEQLGKLAYAKAWSIGKRLFWTYGMPQIQGAVVSRLPSKGQIGQMAENIGDNLQDFVSLMGSDDIVMWQKLLGMSETPAQNVEGSFKVVAEYDASGRKQLRVVENFGESEATPLMIKNGTARLSRRWARRTRRNNY